MIETTKNVPALRFPEFGKAWAKNKLGNLVQFNNGKAHEQVIDLNGDYIVVNSKFISSEGKVKKYTNNQICALYIGDVVMVMSDVPKGKALAKCYLIKKDNLYSLNQRICSLRALNANPYFLFLLTNRNKYFLKFDTKVSQTNLRKEEVLRCPVYIPRKVEQ